MRGNKPMVGAFNHAFATAKSFMRQYQAPATIRRGVDEWYIETRGSNLPTLYQGVTILNGR